MVLLDSLFPLFLCGHMLAHSTPAARLWGREEGATMHIHRGLARLLSRMPTPCPGCSSGLFQCSWCIFHWSGNALRKSYSLFMSFSWIVCFTIKALLQVLVWRSSPRIQGWDGSKNKSGEYITSQDCSTRLELRAGSLSSTLRLWYMQVMTSWPGGPQTLSAASQRRAHPVSLSASPQALPCRVRMGSEWGQGPVRTSLASAPGRRLLSCVVPFSSHLCAF